VMFPLGGYFPTLTHATAQVSDTVRCAVISRRG